MISFADMRFLNSFGESNSALWRRPFLPPATRLAFGGDREGTLLVLRTALFGFGLLFTALFEMGTALFELLESALFRRELCGPRCVGGSCTFTGTPLCWGDDPS